MIVFSAIIHLIIYHCIVQLRGIWMMDAIKLIM